MEKFKDFIYEQSDLFFTAVIVVVVGIIITSNLYGWFDIKDKENKYTEITEVIQQEQTNADTTKNDESKDADEKASLTAKENPIKENSAASQETKNSADVKKEIRNVDIAPGSSSSSIAKSLENQGLVQSSTEFLNLLVSSGKETKLKAGTFSITEGSTNQQIIDILTR
ncbi:MAG: endolytic transglycosylase MltG [Proteocatella sp.]